MATLGWWHHSVENTIDKLDWSRMAVHLRVYAAWLWELCTAPVLPFDFVAVAGEFTQRLAQLGPAGQEIGLQGALERAEAFCGAAERLDVAATVWRARYAAGHADPTVAGRLNACFKGLSRLLLPVASTVKGAYAHDAYGLTAQGSMLPSLFELPQLAGLKGESRWTLETQLVRERNRVADALGDATALINATLGDLT
jgi:hypothetical protein